MDKQDILEAIDYLKLDISDYSDHYDLYEAIDYNGSMNQMIDSSIDIYYHDLRKWSVDNYDFIDDAIEQGLCEDSDFHKMIQSGQYVYYSELSYKLVEEIFNDHQESEVA